ncbi:MAG TPA: hypothetical protein VEY93_14295 [Longimicrobium sp.]|nr:hypothetical protein [Longimicrobium sp.]
MRRTLAVVGLATLAACVDAPDVTAPVSRGQYSIADTLFDDPSRADEILSSRIARRVPEFGGVSSDSTGALVVYLTNPRNAAAVSAVRGALGGHFAEHSRYWSAQGVESRLVVREGKYTFAYLRRIRDRLNADILRTPGVLFTDLDELANRFVVGLDAAYAAQAQAAIRRLSASGGIDPEAMDFEVRSIEPCYERTCQEPKPYEPCSEFTCQEPEPYEPPNESTQPQVPTDIRHLMPKLVGGVQLQNERKGGEATLGFVAYYCGQADVTQAYANDCRDW